MGEIAQKGKKQQPKNQKGVTYFCVFFFLKILFILHYNHATDRIH